MAKWMLRGQSPVTHRRRWRNTGNDRGIDGGDQDAVQWLATPFQFAAGYLRAYPVVGRVGHGTASLWLSDIQNF